MRLNKEMKRQIVRSSKEYQEHKEVSIIGEAEKMVLALVAEKLKLETSI